MKNSIPLEIKVWGDFACFTRPEMKAERVTYPVMTPSAARGVLEAIFWRPEFSWLIREIWVLSEIRHISWLRNEVNSTAVVSTARKWATSGGGYYAEEDRAQRHTLALRDVAYLIKADVHLQQHADAHVAKYRDMFRRRVQRGQCHHQPYLGCREFTGFFSPPSGDERPITHTDDLGRILFDLEFAPDRSGSAVPRFFNARLENGKLRVPPELYERRGASSYCND
ncbi:MAG: type I-C CRISPR-associated protein Cas5 [Desulforudis sp.]|nr:MAG: type I-C CRISPR-associated protein Cas5 [Desulforudis sp.]